MSDRRREAKSRKTTKSDAVQGMDDLADMMAVLAVRLPMMAMTPTPQRAREMERMVSEKAVAAVEGSIALQLYWARMATTLWLGGPQEDPFAGAVEAFAAPGRRTLRANARRLSKKSRS